MLNSVAFNTAFNAVPHLTSTALFAAHPVLKLSTSKVNVIVGPNGSGKSAYLRALATRYFATTTGKTTADHMFCDDHDYPHAWTNEGAKWRPEFHFCKGLTPQGNVNGMTYYFDPAEKPGHYDMLTAALMSGYSAEVKEFDKLTKQKSSGQQKAALMAHILDNVIVGKFDQSFKYINWRGSKDPVELSPSGAMPWDLKAEVMKKLLPKSFDEALVLLDEPEQSLDAMSELRMWQKLENKDESVQVIVATHSLYPFMNPDLFNIIEAEPGYVKQVTSALYR